MGFKGGESGPALVPGQPEKTADRRGDSLYRSRFAHARKRKLSAAEIAAFEHWVQIGAPDPRKDAPAQKSAGRVIDFNEGRKFWCFQPLKKPLLPEVKNAAWAANEIDRFVLAKLEEKGLAPVPLADKRTLIRRTFD